MSEVGPDRHGAGDRTVGTGGILDPGAAARAFSLVRVPPAEDLAALVERHWVLDWELPPGTSFTQVVVPHPCVNLVVEADGTDVHGIPTGLFERTLTGRGIVVGTKFRPGGFRPLFGRSMTGMRGVSAPVVTLLGPAVRGLELEHGGREILATARRDPAAAVREVERALRALPALADAARRPDPRLAQVDQVFRAILSGGADLTRVMDLAGAVGLSRRGLERLLRDYVGVSPKWVLQRHRVHLAAELLATRPDRELATLAVELGYFDQAHFARDFAAALGAPPAAYAQRCAQALERAATA